MKPQLLFTDIKSHPAAREYYDKYNQIDTILERNSSILNEIHRELEMSMNTKNGKVSKYSTETIFRMFLIKCIEKQCSKKIFRQVLYFLINKKMGL
jgi:hypothetical protein